MARRAACAVALVLTIGGRAVVARAAADRPSEDEMFGGAPAAPPGAGGAAGTASSPGEGAAAGAPGGTTDSGAPVAGPAAGAEAASQMAGAPSAGPDAASSRDTDLLGDPKAGPRLSQDVAPEDPLKIGGQIYLRAFARATEGIKAADIPFSTPTLVDGYFDARPNPRVRGYVLARMSFDPTLPTTAATSSTMSSSATGMGTNGMLPSLSVPLLSGVQSTRGPSVLLDQLWLRFDLAHTVFLTVGRQHVKWGTGRIWSPTDFLHPQARNPLAAFDARPGFTMLKAHVPWEEMGWNFYGFALFEGVQQVDRQGRPVAGSDSSPTLGQLGVAGRAEIVVGAAELGLDAVAYRGRKPKLGADLSFGLGDFDLYVDAALRYASEVVRRGYDADVVPSFDANKTQKEQLDEWVDAKYPVLCRTGLRGQVTVGGTYSLKYNDNDVFTVTGEYFYNALGYDDPRVYPGLFFSNSLPFFYLGRHYAALSAIAAAPYSWNYTTFTFTTLGNLSDQSFISRLDYSVVLLTHLRFEAFGAVNYGRREGEFRLGSPIITVPNVGTFALQPQSFSLGLGLRISI